MKAESVIEAAMLRTTPVWFVLAAVILVGGIVYATLRRHDFGCGRFFSDQTYHFETLRALSYVPSDGADTSEVLETIKHVRSRDAQGWFRGLSQTGDQVSSAASRMIGVRGAPP